MRRVVFGSVLLGSLAILAAWIRQPRQPQEPATSNTISESVELEHRKLNEIAPAPNYPGILARFGDTRLRHSAPVRSLALSADGKLLATTTATEAVIRLWDVATAGLVKELMVGTKDTARVTLVGMTPGGTK